METVQRPWGYYEVLFQHKNWIVKRLVLNPKSRISLQYHKYREEIWFIVSGKGRATVDGETIGVKKGSRIEIPKRDPHRLKNSGDYPLVVIEIATGTKVYEDDIVRLQDDYGRK